VTDEVRSWVNAAVSADVPSGSLVSILIGYVGIGSLV